MGTGLDMPLSKVFPILAPGGDTHGLQQLQDNLMIILPLKSPPSWIVAILSILLWNLYLSIAFYYKTLSGPDIDSGNNSMTVVLVVHTTHLSIQSAINTAYFKNYIVHCH